MRRAILLSAAMVLAAGWAVQDAAASAPGAGAGPARPLQIRAATLAQDGQELVWHLALAQPFSPGGLARDHRTLCLLLERPRNGSVAGDLCLAGPTRNSRVPRVLYAPISRTGRGPSKAIGASVSRSSTHEISVRFLPGEIGRAYNPLRWQVISTLRPPGCTPLVPNRAGCFALFPARPALLRMHVPVPIGCVAAGSSLVFNGSRTPA